MYWRYVRREDGFTNSVQERNDPINYFRYHNIDTGPYEAALAALGFGQHDVRRRTGGAAFDASAAMTTGTNGGVPTMEVIGTGACGLAYTNASQRQEQEIASRYGRCAAMGGTQVASAAVSSSADPAPRFADGGELGACGIPYLDDYEREEQVMVAEDGECAEYVAEVEAEGY